MCCRMLAATLLVLPFLHAGCADSGNLPPAAQPENASSAVASESADAGASDTSSSESTQATEAPADKPSSSDRFATPAQAVETMLAAAQAGNASLLGSCFANDAPGEFQVFRSGTATSKQIDEFKEFVQEATVGEETIDESGQKAVVQVQFKRRAEELNLVKTTEGWKVLDF
ncbi:MAG: hypothetical protein VX346_13645 [Planctomycetota bacterium]|nr:hypothetical protein [Planctomycetota bacterium]